MKTYIYYLIVLCFSTSINPLNAKTTYWIGGVGWDSDCLCDASDNYFHEGNWSYGRPFAGDLAIIQDVEYDPWINDIFGEHDFNYDVIVKSGASFYLNDFALIHSDNSIVVEEGGVLYLHTEGVLTIDGTLTNNGILTISDKKFLINGPVKFVVNDGTYTNNYFTFVHEDIRINPNGTLINNATLNIEANPWDDDDYLSGDHVTNKGVLINNQDGNINILSASGKLYNEGNLLNMGTITNHKDFWNKSSGVLDNEGMIINEYAFKNSGTTNNSGIINNDGGTFENHLNTVNNIGEFIINNQGYYVSTSSVAEFINDASGIFTVAQSSNFQNNLGIFTNEGSFENNGNFLNRSAFENSGTLINNELIELQKHLPPNVGSKMYNFGTLDNNQTIHIYEAELINHEYVENVTSSISIFELGKIINEECAVFNNGSTIDNYGTFSNAGFLAQWLGRGIGPVPVQHTSSGSQLDRSMPNVSYDGVNKLYVKNVGFSSNQSGLSWSDATKDLNFAMQMAICQNITEIWISKGTYVPNENSSGFYFQGGLKLYGGFNGNESSKNNRNIMANKTILSNNGPGSILTVVDAPGTSMIDGVHFVGGSASKGGAIHHSNSSRGSALTLRRCVFQDNTASSWGGALYNEGLSSSRSTITILENCIFYANTANWGGAININGVGINPTTGANSSKVILRYSTFLDNTAGSGGADIRSYNAGLDAFNNILWSFGPMAVYSGDVEVDHCVVRNGYAGGTNIITQNPLLVDPESGDFSLRVNSPAIDAGNGSITQDIMGVSRPQGSAPDIGAYEYTGTLPVELLNFSAHLNDQSVFLEWITGNEINNDYFEVERSFDTKIWKSIGLVEGAGDSDKILEYQFIDYDPSPGVNYYRLKQVDYDGQYEYSSIQKVSIQSLYTATLFPNPSHDFINLKLPKTTSEASQIRVYDALGKKLHELTADTSHKTVLNIDLKSMNIYNPGRYHLVILSGNNIEKLSFIKI